jgi:hypothetical protein
MTTPRLGAPELATSQANKEETVNEQICYVEQGAGSFTFKDRDLATPPGSPSDGDCYLVAASATGAWSGQAGKIAFYMNTSWEFITAKEGFTAWINDEDIFVGFNGTTWDEVTTANPIEVLDEGASETANLVSLDFVGAGVSASDDGSGNVTVTITGGGGGGGAWQLQWGPFVNEAPSSNYATLDTRNGHPCLDFDTTTQEAAIFTGVLPPDYLGGGITVTVFCSMTSATSGTVGWLVSIERINASGLDIDADSFATAQTITATTVPGTSGQVLAMSVNISNGANMDSLAAGELFRIKIERDVSNDTATGDAELLRVLMVEQ